MTFPSEYDVERDSGFTNETDDIAADALAAYRELSGDEAAPAAPHGGDEQAAAAGTRGDGEAEQRGARDRGSDGRFRRTAPDERKPGSDASAVSKDGGDQAGRDEGARDGAAPTGAPPSSWGVKAKAAWDSLPEDVRAEIGKREGEVAQGLAALREFKDIKPYADLATQHGTTIKAALDNYVAVDRLLGQDLAGGLAVVAEKYSRDRATLGRTFANLAARYGANVASPQQKQELAQGGEDDPLAEALKPFLQPLISQINDMKSQHTQRAEADRNAQVGTLAAEIQRFAADPKNVYFANVEADIVRLFAGGVVPNSGNPAQDLKTAYDMACRLNPEVSAALIEKQTADRLAAERQREREKAEKARNASRSVGGSRTQGLTVQQQGQTFTNSHGDIEADVIAAMRSLAS